MDKFKNGGFKLHTAKGTMFLQYDNDDLEMVSFPRELLRDSASLDIHYECWAKIGVEKAKVDDLVAKAIESSSKQQ